MLTQRQKQILQAIVRQYTATGQPVGSKLLADKLPIKVSSATIRNEMAVLEREGFVKKEHSSSGHKIDEIVSHSADILSALTSYTAFTLKPEQKDVHLSGFRLVPLGNQKVIAILVTDSGEVESQSFTLPKNLDTQALEAVVRLINDQLVGLPLVTVVKHLQTDIPLKVSQYLHSPDGFLQIFDSVLGQAAREKYFVGGRLNILGYSDRQNPQALRALYGLLDQSDNLSSIIDSDSPNDGVNVKIGSEIADNQVLNDYSLITATYDVNQYGKGIIAVLGPTRMPYSRTIGLVDAFRRELAKRLLDYYHNYYDL